MSTSGTFAALDTASQIITDALIELGVYSASQTLKPADGELGRRRLNWMLKEWQDDGCNLWRVEDISIAWPAGIAEADLDIAYLDIKELRLRDPADRALQRYEQGDYSQIPNKTTTGSPSIYSIRRRLGTLRLSLWPVPAGAVTLVGTGSRVIEDVTSLNDNIDVPQQYTRTVMMNLAANLAPAFARASDPNALVTIREAAKLYQIMRANDRPASYFMGPERGGNR